MLATLWLLGCVLAPAQAGPRPSPAAPAARGGDWVLVPRLARGQELVYRGTYTEEAKGPRVQFGRAYRFETRAFVLDAPPRGADLAVLTTLKHRDPVPGKPAPRVQADPVSGVARLERVQLDLQGKVSADPNVALAVPVDGAPTLEVGAFVAVPGGRLRPGQSWQETEKDRPARTWEVAGTEMVGGGNCVKLVGVQQTDTWDRPRADRGAWRRRDTVWLSLRLGFAARVERVLEQREPARTETSLRGTLRYDLESCLPVPGGLAEDRRLEVRQALALRAAAAPLLAVPSKHGSELVSLQKKIAYHLEHQPPTPFREAVLQLKAQVEAARRGEAAPAAPAPAPDVPVAPAVLALGKPAPDFLAGDFTATGSARLGKWAGRPVVLVFYHPASSTAGELLRFAQSLHTTYARHAHVVGLCTCDDADKVLKHRDEQKVTFPVLRGSGLRVSYAVEATPKVVLIDAAGVARGAWLGWGKETADEVVAELRHWLPKR